MIFGSISAIRENNIRRMIAFSSVAQVGYIYMGLGLGTTMGMVASFYHILSHAATKSLLFIAAHGLTDVSNGRRDFKQLTGAAYRNRNAGFAFTVGCLSIVGFPLLAGFVSKVLFAQASVEIEGKMFFVLFALAISTILNTVYFLKTMIRIYTPISKEEELANGYVHVTIKQRPRRAFALIVLVIINLILGLASQPIIELIEAGLSMFA